MKPTRTGWRILLLLIFFILPMACGDKPEEKAPVASGDAKTTALFEVDVLRLAGGDWGYPTPFAHYPRGPGGFKMCLIFDSLLERDEKGLIPWLAESYRIADDGLTYWFVVRRNVLWQDGRPLTADDVAFSLTYANRHAATWSYIFDTIESVTLEGEQTVCVKLKQPHAAMLDNIGRTRIIPRHIWETVDRPKEFIAPEAVVGCGPYRLTDYDKAHGTYRFEAFEKYWGPRQRVGAIEYVPVGEATLAYEKGEIDLTTLSPDVMPRFKDDPTHNIVRSPAFWGYRLLMNMEAVAGLRERPVRQALAYAIDRKELVEKIARGAAVPGRMGILPPDHVMAAQGIHFYSFDPQQAELLLDGAGFRRMDTTGLRQTGDGQPLELTLLCSSQEVRMAELLRQRLGEVGIGVKVISVDGKTRDSRVRAADYQLAILGHGGWGGDPDYLRVRFAGGSMGPNAAPSHSGLVGYNAPVLLDLLNRQQTEIDPARRRQLIGDIQRELAEQVPEIPLFYTTAVSIYRPARYDGWMFMYDHHSLPHGKLSYLTRSGVALKR
ncbi:diguanylate phosphodiesterase [Desulfosarcina ovata subsp. sediminis]|uniref:Diguanylate phosphodiesterase n=1 Tax=Desulfosarcina ovata subsp. sediminis TaxID=885957 RepID=A0A5K7ZEU2_9BACT|nr:ABC transporter substrate-binding protein [Desulfosarcina ovata]BBO80658.1 diguanylate phosphodiesterase [Desulfosarcina ovata subsp. sediminis]